MGAIPRNGVGGSGAVPRGGARGTTAQARNGLTGAMAIARPGSEGVKTSYPGKPAQLSPQVTAQIQHLLPGILANAPTDAHGPTHSKTPGAGEHGGGVREAYITAALTKAGVPLQDGQHVMPNGQVIQDPGWWEKYGTMVLTMAGIAGGGLLAGALAPGLTGAEAAGSSIWDIGPTTGANFIDGFDMLGPTSTGTIMGTDAAVNAAAPAAISSGFPLGSTGAGVADGLLGPSAETAANAAGGAGATSGASSAAGGGGFLSSLAGKGGGLLKTLAGAGSGIAITAGSIEAQRAKAAAEAARIQQDQDRLAQSRALIGLRAPSMQAANSVRGDVLANSQDATFSGLPSYVHVPTMSGGLRPSMLSDNSRQLGKNMSRDALAHQLAHDDVPDLTPLPSSGGGDSLLQGLAIGGGLLSTLKGLGGSGSSASPTGGGYNGPGTPGYPGDGNSPVNPMIPPVPTDGMDPNEMAWWQQQAAGGFA